MARSKLGFMANTAGCGRGSSVPPPPRMPVCVCVCGVLCDCMLGPPTSPTLPLPFLPPYAHANATGLCLSFGLSSRGRLPTMYRHRDRLGRHRGSRHRGRWGQAFRRGRGRGQSKWSWRSKTEKNQNCRVRSLAIPPLPAASSLLPAASYPVPATWC